MNPANDHTKHLVLMITYECNLQCTYCYEHHLPDRKMTIELALQTIRKTFDDISKDDWYERLEIIFMGGEPLKEWQTIKQIVEHIEACNDLPLPYHFFTATNGTLLTQEKRNWIEQRKDHFILGISVDGNDYMQAKNRGKASKGIDLEYFLSTWPNQPPKTTISPYTISNLAQGIIYLHKTGFRKINANLAFGQEWEHSTLKVYAEQLDILADFYLVHPEIERCSLLNLNLLIALNLKEKKRKFCGCGEMMACIDTDGTEYACQMFAPITLGEKRAKETLNINFKNHADFVNDKCSQCILNILCPRCYGMSYKQTGDIRWREPFLCSAFKIQFIANCKLAENMLLKNIDMEDADIIRETLIYIKNNLFKITNYGI